MGILPDDICVGRESVPAPSALSPTACFRCSLGLHVVDSPSDHEPERRLPELPPSAILARRGDVQEVGNQFAQLSVSKFSEVHPQRRRTTRTVNAPLRSTLCSMLIATISHHVAFMGLTRKTQTLGQLDHAEEVHVRIGRLGRIELARRDLPLDLTPTLQRHVPPIHVVQDHVEAREVEADTDDG